ncbi:metabolite traffic protein EboE [Cognataquiflexum rubidum]|uniref:metabolite traffic protein EboE n=1 Tax=Cognataquiflexum rubidum TaxID=2922273 RepID=UPI001F136805|nr:metabolite traffic protein EboE [Cognataquiflexum rubidum]MCH6234732.1 metabolite traffic protein EboE [Cognataquiflexum rubidum]
MFKNGHHLTYCTNIHPGESWEATFQNLKEYIPRIKAAVSPNAPFGIGLRSSHEASLELAKTENLKEFKSWLAANDCYVFTFNGFPYGGFHNQVVKDEVHQPDWTTRERWAYTDRLFDILATLIPDGMDGGISTSPLSYRHWHKDKFQMDQAIQSSTLNFAKIAEKLYLIHKNSGKLLHLDIEPEPDGILENTQEVLDFYQNWLVPVGGKYLTEKLGISSQEAESCLKEHIRICYDICHFAVVYEKPAEIFQSFRSAGIKIGKIQISAALKVNIPKDQSARKELESLLSPFAESTYLHQVVARNSDSSLVSFNDLPEAMETLESTASEEWRIHYHVPVFLADYGKISSTQQDILDVLNYIAKDPVCNHLEVETYTWEVLPESINLDLGGSIIRELQWVIQNSSNP